METTLDFSLNLLIQSIAMQTWTTNISWMPICARHCVKCLQND